MGLGAQVARGGAVASSTRDVGAEKAAARSSGGSYARPPGRTGRAHEQREGKAGAGARKAAALTGGPARAERGGGGRGARAGLGRLGRKAEGAAGLGLFAFFFYSELFFPFLFFTYSI